MRRQNRAANAYTERLPEITKACVQVTGQPNYSAFWSARPSASRCS